MFLLAPCISILPFLLSEGCKGKRYSLHFSLPLSLSLSLFLSLASELLSTWRVHTPVFHFSLCGRSLQHIKAMRDPKVRGWKPRSAMFLQPPLFLKLNHGAKAHSTPLLSCWCHTHTNTGTAPCATQFVIVGPGCTLADSTPLLFFVGRLPASFWQKPNQNAKNTFFCKRSGAVASVLGP